MARVTQQQGPLFSVRCVPKSYAREVLLDRGDLLKDSPEWRKEI
jgi:hypothetical protein